MVQLDGGAGRVTQTALRFQVGARTLLSVRRRLVRLALSLDDALAEHMPDLPPDAGGDGYLVTSLPATLADGVRRDGYATMVRQRYTRFYTDLTQDYDDWLASMSGSARSTLKRKTKRAMAAGMRVVSCRTVADFAIWYPQARAVSALTYQERLLHAGLPDDSVQVARLSSLAADDALRAWLLLIEDTPVAYLCCTAQGSALRYDHVGHDPAYADWSPGTVLHAAAMRDLFADRFARFDFTEGEGQHKRQFATDGVACVDILMLRPTWMNRGILAALAGFDETMARAKRLPLPNALTRMLRR